MGQAFDLLSLFAFFICYKMYDIYAASGILIFMTSSATALELLHRGRLRRKVVVNLLLTIALCIPTLIFRDARFIQWKVTVVYGFFSFSLAYSQLFTKKPLVQSILEDRIRLSNTTWHRLNTAWFFFFLICGLVNIFVAYQFSEATWVDFKVFGLTGITLVFSIFSGIYVWQSVKESSS